MQGRMHAAHAVSCTAAPSHHVVFSSRILVLCVFYMQAFKLTMPHLPSSSIGLQRAQRVSVLPFQENQAYHAGLCPLPGT